MAAYEQSCCEVCKDPDTEQDVERLDDLARGQERRRDDEQHRDDIEHQQGIAETDPALGFTLVKLADIRFQGSEGHGDIIIRLGVLLQSWIENHRLGIAMADEKVL